MSNVEYKTLSPDTGAIPRGVVIETEQQVDGSQRQVVSSVIRDANGAQAAVSARVQTPTGNVLQVQIGPGDVISNIPIFTAFEHHQIHEGEMWQALYGPAAIANGAVLDHLVIVANVAATTRTPHMVVEVDSTGETWVQIYEAPTVSANGTAVTCFNRNRNVAGSPTTTIFRAPTVTLPGTNFTGWIIGSGEKSGGSGRDANEWDLATNTKYLIRITAKNANNIAVRLQFYEDHGV